MRQKTDTLARRSVTATEFKNRTGQYLDESGTTPVFITRHGREVRVLLGISDYDNLCAKTCAQIPLKDEIIGRLLAHKDELGALGIDRLSLFGSVARGEASEHSDVDLVVLFKPEAKVGLRIVSIKKRLEDIIGRPVDLLRSPIEKSRLLKNITPDLIHAF